MAKVCEKLFPKGSFPKQQSDGFYLHKDLKNNFDIMIKAMGRDMQFVGIISGKGTVRSGKSTVAQQLGTYITEQVNEIYKVNNTFDINNILFTGDDLMEKAVNVPKYSVLVLDEGDDLTLHWAKDLAQKLKRFFRKCGQLNLFIFIILPDFFELPRPYAITRTNFLINVYFYGEFERGYFEFYSGKSKKFLYIKGKKFNDYDAQSPDFDGRFIDLYTVDKELYAKKKLEDLNREDKKEKKKPLPEEIIKAVKKRVFVNIMNGNNEKLKKNVAKVLEVNPETIRIYKNEAIKEGLLRDSIVTKSQNLVPILSYP